MVALNKSTTIPLFAIIYTLPFILGAAFFIWNADAKASTALHQQEGQMKILWHLQQAVNRLEVKEGTLPDEEK
jgi:hypothetical protein